MVLVVSLVQEKNSLPRSYIYKKAGPFIIMFLGETGYKFQTSKKASIRQKKVLGYNKFRQKTRLKYIDKDRMIDLIEVLQNN